MAKSANSSAKILLADDSVTMHRAVSLGLKKEPFDVVYCDNGQDALRLTREHRPLIVLADLDMPGMTGGELCRAIKSDPELSQECKVILLCGSFDQVDEKEIESIPADARLWKPFESHVLVSMIHTLLKIPPKFSSEATAQFPRPSSSLVDKRIPNIPAEATEDFQKPETSLVEEDTSLHLPGDAWRSSFEDATSLELKKDTPKTPPPPLRPPPPPKSDFTEEMGSPKRRSFQDPEEKEFTSSFTIEGAKENLWDREFENLSSEPSEIQSVSNLFEDESSSSLEESFFPEKGGERDFEVVEHSRLQERPSEENIKRASSSTEAFSGFDTKKNPSSAAGVSREDLRQLIAEEIDKALSGYFKDRLEQRLKDILKVIENSSKN